MMKKQVYRDDYWNTVVTSYCAGCCESHCRRTVKGVYH